MSGRRLATVAVVVRDYDEAIAWYVQKLGFALAEDVDLGAGKRWVALSAGPDGARLLLALADGAEQAARIGDQTGGRVFLFLETDDFARDHAAMLAKGVS
ncbi:VOC family protein, partial [Mesorhizobium marinum]|uniref:VOC family protein n=1 Tax=Mesorhizobium marinum TaxID=3228790 RepID=UPI003467A983